MFGDEYPNFNREKSFNSFLTSATPNARKTDASRIARRSAGFSLIPQTKSLADNFGDSPTTFNISKTPISRNRLLDQYETPSQIRTSFSKVPNYTPKKHKTTFNESLEMSLSNTFFNDDSNDFTSKIIFENDPTTKASNVMYQEFHEKYMNNPSEQNSFDLILDYEQSCIKMVKLLHDINKNYENNSISQSQQLLNYLTLERNSWRLIRILYQDRVKETENDIEMNFIGPRISDKQILDNLFQRDTAVRQSQLIVDWLEANMANDLEHSTAMKVQYFSESHVTWENTLHSLEKISKNKLPSGVRPLVTELDPDAPNRQKRPLHDQDVDDENRLFKYILAFIMSGKLDEAQKTAERNGYFWLAAAVEGWRPFHDPNYNSTLQEGQSLFPTEGNQYRDIWKANCWKIIEREVCPLHERAIYCALSGHLGGLLPVCSTWEEQLWAYTKVLVDSKVDEEINGATQMERTLIKLPATNFKIPLSLEHIFKELEASPDKEIRDSCSSLYHIVQRQVILDNHDDLLISMLSCLQSDLHNIPHQFIRFMAHFVLFLRLVGWTNQEKASLAILEYYVILLIELDQRPLVATYVSTLPADLQIELYAKFLEPIDKMDEQRICLEWAEIAGLDVHSITKKVVENIRNQPSEIKSDIYTHQGDPQLSIETNMEDEKKIAALDWLIFDISQRAEATKQANSLMRVFVACRKMDAAQKTIAKLPSDTISIISKHWKRLTNSDELPAEEDNATREYLCFQIYLQALEAFNDWFEHFNHSKPIEPVKPKSKTVKFTDWVAYEQKFKEYESDFERWQQALSSQTRNTVDRLYNVLLFPDGGWMIDQRETDESFNESRRQQMALLRRLCIPQICALLQNVLHCSKQYKEAIQLADVIADEKNSLYLEFNKQELRDLLLKVRQSSLELLDQNLNPFGYPYQ